MPKPANQVNATAAYQRGSVPRNNEGHVPIRTCIGCKKKSPKHEMLRVVATEDGRVIADPRGSMPGRGAYVCYSEPCLEAVTRRLVKALRLEGMNESAIMQEWETVKRTAMSAHSDRDVSSRAHTEEKE